MADPGALNPEQESLLGAWKIQTRIDNERYLRSHQEVRLLLSAFTREVLLHRPENIRQFAADYFTDPMLAAMIREKMSRSQPEEEESDGQYGGGAPRGTPAPLDPCTSVPSLLPPPPSSTC